MELLRVRASEVDASDVQVLPSNRDATNAAEKAKTEGNRLFRANDFRAAEKCYTNGLQVVGAVDPMMLAQLFNNRSTARWHRQDLANAKQDAKRAAELAPHWSKPHVRLVAIYAAKTKHAKAVARLEMALGLASAEHDKVMVEEITKKMSEYRLRRDEEARCESENLAYGPMSSNEGAFRAANQARAGLDETEDPMAMTDKMLQFDWNRVGMGAKKHVLLGQRARQDGRLDDAAREFMAAAVGGDAEGMYNYAICQLKGRGTRKDIPAAIRWLEKAAVCPPTQTPTATLDNVGVGEALTTLGSFYDAGIHFDQDKTRAREYWERAAELAAATGMNQFGICLMNGTHGVQKDLPRAREMFRRSAEMLHNEAMSNLAVLHGLLHEYETAARWADAAFRLGFVPAADTADRYRLLAAQREAAPKEFVEMADRVALIFSDRTEQPTPVRRNSTPTLDKLRAVGTPYGKQLLMAKEMMLKAMEQLTSSDPVAVLRGLELAGEAHRMEDGMLVFSEDDNYYAFATATYLQDMACR
ncbi:hypothetical protein PR001_g29253 [Phytophthora rubi]|uniref:Uncharacterized protein n=1 Tax=Phytophthora rubi TaxID=129364 RepID=A0A6A3H3P6_9STRA|nr:hypothetical protein PR002_g29206 [Phytophthora rubi]KAE8963825.1 hypothetical protein PR001_g29253 [Phytophthora rubi]